jgi:hypothetical protein
MAGTIPLSMTQQFDLYGQPLAGGQLYIIQVGTVSTPQDAFQDVGLTIKQPYPMTLDAAGRVPQFFVSDGSVKIRLQDKSGVVQLAADNVLVIGPSSGGGGSGSTVDPTQLITMGNMILRYGVGVLTGYVRLNNLTIGSATSGATERANLDCQNLFQYLWGIDTSLAVSGGRGATASADWTANKQLTLPDWRGYAFACLDDMGNASANRYGGWFPNTTTLGSAAGVGGVALGVGNIPPHSHNGSGTTGGMDSANPHSHPTGAQDAFSYAPNAGAHFGFVTSGGNTGNTDINHGHNYSFTTDGGNSCNGSGFASFAPRKLCTAYIKL